MLLLSLILLFLTSLRQQAVEAASSLGRFINPADADLALVYTSNPTWRIGELQRIQWQTGLSTYNVTIFQQNLSVAIGTPGLPIYTKKQADPEVGYVDWVVTSLAFSVNASNVFYFLISQGNDPGATSHYVNFTDKAVLSSTTSATPTSTSSFSLSTSSTATTAITTPTQAATSTPDSTAIKVGLGVGLGIGIPLVLILGVWVGLMALRRRHPASHRVSGRSLPPAYEVEAPKDQIRLVEQQIIHEMRSKQESPVELDSHFSGAR